MPSGGLPTQARRRRGWPWLFALGVAGWPAVAHAAGMSDETFYGILLLMSAVGAGYVVTHIAVDRLSRRFAFARGVEYVALGIVLGPVLGIIDIDIARAIRPMLLLGSGALGMLTGLELMTKTVVRRGRVWLSGALLATTTAAAVTGLPLAAMALLGFDLAADAAWTGAIIAGGVVALGSDAVAVRGMATHLRARGPAPHQAALVANVLPAIATIGLGILYALLAPSSVLSLRPAVDAAGSLGVQVGIGFVLGMLFGVIVHRQIESRVLLTVLLGFVFLAGGMAYSMYVSGIFVCFVTGVIVGRTCRQAPEVTRLMINIKRPFVIAMYFFAGLVWFTGVGCTSAWAPGWAGRGGWGGGGGGALSSRLFSPPMDVGAATLPAGGLTIAVLLSLRLVYGDVPGMRDVYAPLLVSIVLIELGSLRSVRRWLLDVADVPAEGRARRGGFEPGEEV